MKVATLAIAPKSKRAPLFASSCCLVENLCDSDTRAKRARVFASSRYRLGNTRYGSVNWLRNVVCANKNTKCSNLFLCLLCLVLHRFIYQFYVCYRVGGWDKKGVFCSVFVILKKYINIPKLRIDNILRLCT